MRYEIKRGDEVITQVYPVGVLTRGIMNANLVRITFPKFQAVDIRRGDYITVYGEKFDLNKPVEYIKDDKDGFVKYTYSAVFESVSYRLAKVSYRFLDANNNFTTGTFTVTGTLDVFVDLLIRNANRVQSGWIKGVVDATETKTLSFAGQKCLEVLATLATEFNTEWWVEGQYIHMTKKGKDSGLSLEYGKGKGLYSLERRNVENANAVNRVYAEGGSKNLPADYRNYSQRLQLPEATGGYLEKNVGPDGIIEHDLVFEDIFPKRLGTVTEVFDNYTFSDTTLDFDVNDQLLPGIPATIVFNTGDLAGYELEIHSFQNDGKKFTINHNKDEKDLEIPSDRLHARQGDRYVLIGIKMPQSYVDAAELEVQAKAQEYLDINSVDRYIYAGEQDRLHFKRSGIVLKLGDYINLKDADLGVDVTPRIISFERDLHDPYYYPNVAFSEHVDIPSIVRQYAEQQKVNKLVLKSPIAKPGPVVTPVKTPAQHDIVFNTGFVSVREFLGDTYQDIPVPKTYYWKDNGMVYFSGAFIQNAPTSPYIPFNLPLGFRPWKDDEAKAPVQIQTNMFSAATYWGTMTVKKNGEVTISGFFPDGRKIEPNQMFSVELTGASFYTGMS